MARSLPARRSDDVPALRGWLAACALCVLAQPGLAQSLPPPSPAVPPAYQAAPPAPQGEAQPQVAEPASEPSPAPAPVEAAPPKPEGFFDAFNRWGRDFKAKVDEANAKWRASVDETIAKLKASADEAAAKFRSGVEENNARWRALHQKNEKATQEAVARQKEAAEAFKNLANTRMVEGRQVCEIAPNGSPDCQSAAERICKDKGFAIGKSADITTTQKCSARALLRRNADECRTVSVVIKAACQ
jgi:hypothetical protein